MDYKSKNNYKKLYLSDKEFMEQIEKADELSFKFTDESLLEDKCFICNTIVDIKKADKIIVDFDGGVTKNGRKIKDFPTGTMTDYFCPVCEKVMCGHTEVKEN